MNAAQWRAAAHPVVADTYAVVSEYLLVPDLAAFDANLRYRYRAAGRRRDPEALRRVCAELKAEAYRMMFYRKPHRIHGSYKGGKAWS